MNIAAFSEHEEQGLEHIRKVVDDMPIELLRDYVFNAMANDWLKSVRLVEKMRCREERR